MANVTFSDLIAQTRMLLDEVSEKDWTEVQVKREINTGYHELVTAVITTYEDFYLDTTLFNLILNQQTYTTSDGLPSNLFKLRRLEFNFDYATNPNGYNKAFPVNLGQVKYSLSNTGIGSYTSPLYIVSGFGSNFKIDVIPIPNKNSTNGGKLWHIKEISDMVNVSDQPQVPYADRYARAIPLYAAGMLLRKGQQEEAVAGRYLQEFDANKNLMVQELEDWVADEAKVITDSLGADLDFGEP